jgi:hypothetical protein
MSKAIAISREFAVGHNDMFRAALVYGCGLALIMAGPVFPI